MQYDYFNNAIHFHHEAEYERPRVRFTSEHHNFYEIYYLESGDVEYIVQGKSYQINPGDILLIGINEVHTQIINKEFYERFVLQFSTYSLPFDPKIINMLMSLFTPEHRLIPSNIAAEFKCLSYLKKIERYCLDPEDEYFATNLNVTIIQLVAQLHKALKKTAKLQPSATANTNIVEKAIAFIDSHICDENLTLDRIAQELFVDKFYLSHSFSDKLHMPLKQYVMRKKMYQADALIKSGMSITKAATTVGYENYHSFFYGYKKIFGRSPSVSKK